NYDGQRKHQTIIEDGAFIGSDATLVAPVRIGKGAYVAAGSSITDDVPPEALGIARGRQTNKEGWVRQRAAAAKQEPTFIDSIAASAEHGHQPVTRTKKQT
ncbi:MAG: DapH/DapD/GlmU-related protein, partial [Terriglobales bacterium]